MKKQKKSTKWWGMSKEQIFWLKMQMIPAGISLLALIITILF